MFSNFNTKNVTISLQTLATLLFFNFTSPLSAQEKPRAISVKYITEKIDIDGVLDEAIWQKADKTADFWQFFPRDSVRSINNTEIKMLYNDNTLYVGIKAETIDKNFVVTSLRRDFAGPTNDNVTFMLDTYNDGTNAFVFSTNAYGVQREALVSFGGATREDFNPTWDVKWQSDSKRYDNYYTLEFAIPFSSLKFKEGGQKWRFQSYRFDLQSKEQSAWSRIPQNQLLSNLATMGEMTFEKPLGKSRAPVYLIPYINTIGSKEYVNNTTAKKLTFGGDAKMGIGNGMNLDLTYNPDFSNVEVDNIITNLTRFEVNLPEKRQFFIDNNDLFGRFGSNLDAIPFFSRRIGIVTDTLGRSIQNNILGGARLSGKLDENWRLGILNIQTAEDLDNKIASNNNAMLALQRKVFNRSNVSAFMINRETFKDYDFLSAANKYNRVFGLDYNLASKSNKWTGKYFMHKSLQPGDSKGNISTQAFTTYNTRKYGFALDFVYVDQDFRSDLGFIPRKGFFKRGTSFTRAIYPKKGLFNSHTFRILVFNFRKPNLNYKKTDEDIVLSWLAGFKNQSTLDTKLQNKYIFLINPFDPTRTAGGEKLPGNTGYKFNQINTTFVSNNADKITYTAMTTLGQFYNGQIYSVGGMANLRIQPKVLITLAANYDRIVLPSPYPSANIALISPKFDFTFSKSLFWSTLIQYSNQRNNLGINSRLQWRFAPLSDLFLVYNDNYYTQDFGPSFRSINLKFTYWLNVSALKR
jgi:Domain of unknown function (DUF5916)/Carbohydrate family 9 binding domain-like